VLPRSAGACCSVSDVCPSWRRWHRSWRDLAQISIWLAGRLCCRSDMEIISKGHATARLVLPLLHTAEGWPSSATSCRVFLNLQAWCQCEGLSSALSWCSTASSSQVVCPRQRRCWLQARAEHSFAVEDPIAFPFLCFGVFSVKM
jgi:hypothetical protein